MKKRKKPHHVSYAAKRRIIVTISALIVLILYILKEKSFYISAASAIALIISFYIMDHFFDIKFYPKHYFYLAFIATTGLILSPLYFLIPAYDKALHFVLPIITSSIVFYMISDLDLKLKWKLTFTFFVVIGILGLFEIGEYALDVSFDWKLQGVFVRDNLGREKFNVIQERIDDTMIDLSLGVLGAGLYWIYMLIINRKRFFKI